MTVLGLVVLVIGVVLLAIEAHASTAGLLAGAGAAALVGGSALAVAGAGGGPLLAIGTGVAVAALAGSTVAIAARRVGEARRTLPRGGASGLVGHVGVVREWSGGRGRVHIAGALWSAEPALSGERIEVGDRVVVDAVDGLTLGVHRADELEVARW